MLAGVPSGCRSATMWTGKASPNSWTSQCRWSYTPRGSHPVSANIAATGPVESWQLALHRHEGQCGGLNAGARGHDDVRVGDLSHRRGKAASVLSQKIDDLGCPGGTRYGEDGRDAVPVEHDAVGLQGGC